MSSDDDQLDLYKNCLTKQLEEIDMLSSIYCTPGEMHIFDPGVISDFNEFLKTPSTETMLSCLKSKLEYNIALEILAGKNKSKLDVRIELPHLYPALENAVVIVHSPWLNKMKDSYFKREIENYIDNMDDKTEPYIFQIISWIQEQIEELITRDNSEFEKIAAEQPTQAEEELLDFERLWIYSHHIKSKTKRQEIVKQARNMDLSGFSRPGKPGIICIEGQREFTQEFWQIIRNMRWQKIGICKVESSSKKTRAKLDKLRRFEGFREQLFCDDLQDEEGVMNMGLFIKYLENHNSAYMKKELFGID